MRFYWLTIRKDSNLQNEFSSIVPANDKAEVFNRLSDIGFHAIFLTEISEDEYNKINAHTLDKYTNRFKESEKC